MSRTHQHQDIYVGDQLAFQEAMVIDNHETGGLTVKALYPDRPNAWQSVLVLHDVTFKGYQGRNAQFWSGLNEAGEPVQLGAVYRAQPGCRQCGGR